MSETLKKIEYYISLLTENTFKEQAKWNLMLKIIGDKCESNEFLLTKENLTQLRQGLTISTNRSSYLHKFKINISEVGKIKKVIWIDSVGLDDILIYELQIEIPYRNELLIFPIYKSLTKTMNLNLEPNLNPGDSGVHYAVLSHTNYQQKTNPKLPHINIVIEITGDKNKTNFIPLQHSQLNKIPFMANKRDVFDVFAVDVGHITQVKLRNHCDPNVLNSNSWYVDNLEIRTFNQSHVYNFHLIKNLMPNEEISLFPMSHSEIDYEVVLRYNEIENEQLLTSSQKLNDIYCIIGGEKGSTKKIHLNNYETRLQTQETDKREKHFEFKSEDVGKLLKMNVSLNEDNNPNNCIFIEYIEIKIPSRKEAYKFPCERTLGAFFEDGRLELDLEVWKHPEKKAHIDYEFKNESIQDSSNKNTHGIVYLTIHGDQGKTGKIELNDGSLINGPNDEYLFNAPDVGKIIKIELFFTPTYDNSVWRIDSLEIKISSRNEAYKFPVQLYLDKKLNWIELEPWKKPNLIR